MEKRKNLKKKKKFFSNFNYFLIFIKEFNKKL